MSSKTAPSDEEQALWLKGERYAVEVVYHQAHPDHTVYHWNDVPHQWLVQSGCNTCVLH